MLLDIRLVSFEKGWHLGMVVSFFEGGADILCVSYCRLLYDDCATMDCASYKLVERGLFVRLQA